MSLWDEARALRFAPQGHFCPTADVLRLVRAKMGQARHGSKTSTSVDHDRLGSPMAHGVRGVLDRGILGNKLGGKGMSENL